MFQNSFVTRLSLRCPIHPNNKITYACPKPTCQNTPFLCDQCKLSSKQHYGHQYDLQKINIYLEKLCQTIKNQKRNIQKLYNSILKQKQNQNLLKWQQQKQQHFQSIQNHLNTLKFQIEEQMRNIMEQFQRMLEIEKDNVYKELESYFQTYKTKFVHFTELTQPVVMMKECYSYYESKNTLTLKLLSLEGNKVSKWFNQLKFYLNRGQLATRKQLQYTTKVQQLSIVTNQLMDQLPRLRNIDFDIQLPQILKQSSKNILKSLVSLRRAKLSNKNQNNQGNNLNYSNSISPNQSNHPHRSTSMNSIPINQSYSRGNGEFGRQRV